MRRIDDAGMRGFRCMHMRAVIVGMVLGTLFRAAARVPRARARERNEPREDGADQRQENDGVKQSHPFSLSSY